MVGGLKHLMVGLAAAGALVAGSAVPASAMAARAVPEAGFERIFDGVGSGPTAFIAIRNARADAWSQAEAAGYDPARCLEGTPDVDMVKQARWVAFVDLFC
ncbi:hypothetical protein ACQP2F_31255 [Actinoplanes sp. CA-030573]|uniref:hypothetical protein n=1 Tax=Actinoplanes sp. CA-030573 TaxID=3239898 RepID=UPI003D8C9490